MRRIRASRDVYVPSVVVRERMDIRISAAGH